MKNPLVFALGALLVASGPAGNAQSTTILNIAHFNTRALAMGIVADSVRGVSVVASPQPGTRVGGDSLPVIWHSFDPDSLASWVGSSQKLLLASADPVRGGDTRWVVSPAPLAGSGRLALGRYTSKGKLGRPALAIADSINGWEFELTMKEADSLARLIWSAATVSRLSRGTTPAPGTDSAMTRAAIRSLPRQRRVAGPGVVLMQYLVDSTGTADVSTFTAILATRPELIPEARGTVAAARFTAATRSGVPVGMLVRQMVVWRGSR